SVAPTYQPPPVMPPVPAYVPPPPPPPPVPMAPPKTDPLMPWIDAPAAARVGEHLVVTVNVDSKSTALNSVLLRVRYDFTKLSLQTVSAGDFMSQTGIPGAFTSDDNSAGGEVAVSLSTEGGDVVGGRGSIAIFDFEAISEGAAVVELQGFEAHEGGGQP